MRKYTDREYLDMLAELKSPLPGIEEFCKNHSMSRIEAAYLALTVFSDALTIAPPSTYFAAYNPTAEKIKKDENLSKLKKEINSLCDRISKELRVENSNLKLQLKKYEEETAKLRILASRTHSSVEDYFKNDILVKQEKIND